jgi:hypothetical protein
VDVPKLILQGIGPRSLTLQRGTGRWELVTDIAADGIFLDSGFVHINDLISAVSTLQLLDVNTSPTQIAFSGTAPDDDLDANLPQNILGAINNQVTIEQTLAAAFGTSCLSGAASSFTATNGVVATGTFVVDGKFYTLAAWDNAVTVPTWVFVDSSATPPVFSSTTSLPLSDPDDLLVAYFPASGGTPDDAIDCRRLLNRVDDKVEVVVGTTGLAGTKLPAAHFATLTEAFAAIAQLENAELYKWNVRVAGVTEEPAADLPIAPPDGTTIYGVTQDALITWDDDETLFDLSGTAGVTFRDLVIGHQGGTADPPSSPTYRIVWGSTTLVDRCTIQNVMFDASTARVNALISTSSTWRNCLIENIGGAAGLSADVGLFFTVLDSSVIRGCQIIQAGTARSTLGDQSGIYLGSTSTKSVIEGCKIEGWEGYGIKVDAATVTYCRIANNGITNCDLNGIQLVGGQFLTITGNTIWDVGGSETGTAAAIYIVFISGGNRNVAVGNQLSGNGLVDNGTNNFHQTATDSDPLNGNQTPV